MSNVLVTGGAGFIGSHACKALARAGYTPIALDNLARGNSSAVKWGPLEEGDLADRDLLARVFATHAPVAVMHFAAYAYVDESVRDPSRYYRNNVSGTLALLDAMVGADCRLMVFSSSCATYGSPDTLPIPEEAPQLPVNPYGRTKLICERMLADFEAAFGLRSAMLRYFNASGADPDGELGEVHDPETHLIPIALQVAIGRRAEFHLFGADYETPDGTCIRDFVHVCDLADAHVLALDWLRKGGPSRAFNLGNGQGTSVRQVVETVRSVTGRDLVLSIQPRRPGDPAALVADATRARRELGWRPAWPDIADHVRHAWQWMRGASARSG